MTNGWQEEELLTGDELVERAIPAHNHGGAPAGDIIDAVRVESELAATEPAAQPAPSAAPAPERPRYAESFADPRAEAASAPGATWHAEVSSPKSPTSAQDAGRKPAEDLRHRRLLALTAALVAAGAITVGYRFIAQRTPAAPPMANRIHILRRHPMPRIISQPVPKPAPQPIAPIASTSPGVMTEPMAPTQPSIPASPVSPAGATSPILAPSDAATAVPPQHGIEQALNRAVAAAPPQTATPTAPVASAPSAQTDTVVSHLEQETKTLKHKNQVLAGRLAWWQRHDMALLREIGGLRRRLANAGKTPAPPHVATTAANVPPEKTGDSAYGYRVLAVASGDAVIEDPAGNVQVLGPNGHLGRLTVYEVGANAVITNFGVLTP